MALYLKWVIIHFMHSFLLIFPSFSESAVQAPIVTTRSGDVRGFWMKTENNRDVESYLGIPYAKPPVGHRRFKDPKPFGKWHGILDGSKEPIRCLQKNVFEPDIIDGSEDCLYLSIYTPSSVVEGKYPVVTFIHGGGMDGYASTDTYGPDKLLSRDIVLVTLHYRLGFLGFGGCNHPDFPGNYGLKDQSLALKWVKKNIANFGGNDSSITVVGESFGAASAHYQVLSPQNEGVFHRAILMSGTADNPWAVSTRALNAYRTAKMGEFVKCRHHSGIKLKKCLRSVNASEFLMNYNKFQTDWQVEIIQNFNVWYDVPQVIFTPCLEPSDNGKAFISEESYKKRSSSIPIMIGATSSEGTINIAMLKKNTKNHFEDALSEFHKRFIEIIQVEANFQDTDPNPKERAARLKKEYFGELSISNETLPQLTHLYSDIHYLNGITSTIKGHKGETFIYKFGYEGSSSVSQVLSGDPNYRNGACHGDDLLYLFPMKPLVSLLEKKSDKDEDMSRKMVDLIVNFATYGNPNSISKTNRWRRNTGNLEYLSINSDGDFEMKTNFPNNSADKIVHCCPDTNCCQDCCFYTCKH